MTKRILASLAFILVLCHCTLGTEVGNGIRPNSNDTVDSESTNTTAKDENSPEDMTLPDAGPSVGTEGTNSFSPFLLVACASPFADKIQGDFIAQNSLPAFRVTTDSSQVRRIEVNSMATSYRVTTLPSNMEPYAIARLDASPNVSCSQVITTSLANGSLLRSVSFSNGRQLSWTLSNAEVSGITFTDRENIKKTWILKAN